MLYLIIESTVGVPSLRYDPPTDPRHRLVLAFTRDFAVEGFAVMEQLTRESLARLALSS